MWRYVEEYWYLIAPTALGVVQWCGAQAHRIPAACYRPIRTGHHEPLTIVAPVYREDPQLFRRAVESWAANDVAEIVCVIQEDDAECLQVAHDYGVTVLTTDRPGKREALSRGWTQASTPLVALVDSDTVWAGDVAAKVCEPFADQDVAGVSPRQSVLDPKTAWQHAAQLQLDNRFSSKCAAQSVMGQALSVLTGPTAVYRREVLVSIGDGLFNESFLGLPCVTGDDTRLTHLTLQAGHFTVLQDDAQVWTSMPDRMTGAMRQRLRHARNTWRRDLGMLGSRWLWKHPFLGFSTIHSVLGVLALPLVGGYLAVLLLAGYSLPAVLVAGWWVCRRSLEKVPYLRRRGESLRLLPALVGVPVLVKFIEVAALLTLHKQGWLTRPAPRR